MRALFIILIGVATMYGGVEYEGNPLFCDTWDTELSFCVEAEEAWIAIPVELYDQGWQCGDDVYVTFTDLGVTRKFKAYDAGYLSDYRTENYPDLSIVADVPEYYWPSDEDVGTPTRVRVFNLSLYKRTYRGYMTGHLRR